jgi:uncharacterized membrane protein
MHFLCAFELGVCLLLFQLGGHQSCCQQQLLPSTTSRFVFSMMYLIEQKISLFLFYFYFYLVSSKTVVDGQLI